MGSAIGDYIHFHSQRYAAFGTERGKGLETKGNETNGYDTGKQVFSKYIQDRKDILMNQKKVFDITKAEENKEYLKVLKELMNNWNMSKKDAKSDYEKGIYEGVQIVKELLKQKFGSVAEKTIKMVEGTFDSVTKKSNGNLSSHDRALINGVKEIEFVDSKTGKTVNHYAGKIADTLYDLEAAVKISKDKGSLSKPKAKEIQTKITELKHYLVSLNDFAEEINSGFYKDVKPSRSKLTLSVKHDIGHKLNTDAKAVKNLYTEINKLIGQVKATEGIRSKYVGQAFEGIAVVAAEIVKNKGYEGLSDILKKLQKGQRGKNVLQGWSGSNSASLYLKDVSFADFLNPESIMSKGYTFQQNQTLGNWTISAEGSQDKIDIMANFNEGTPLYISAKNYHIGNSKSVSIHLVTESPLFVILLATATPDFINHFLNVTAINYDKDQNDSKVTEAKNLAKKAIQLIILETALKGYRGENKADTFLVNDSITGEVKMLSIADLICGIISQEDWQKYFWISNKGLPKFHNKWQPIESGEENGEKAAERRIQDLLMQAYNYKVSAGIYSGALDLVAKDKILSKI